MKSDNNIFKCLICHKEFRNILFTKCCHSWCCFKCILKYNSDNAELQDFNKMSYTGNFNCMLCQIKSNTIFKILITE